MKQLVALNESGVIPLGLLKRRENNRCNFEIHFKNYRKEIILAIITIWFLLCKHMAAKIIRKYPKAILADNQSVVLRDGIELVVLGLLAIIAGIFNVYYAAKIAQGITSDLREETYAKIQSFSFGNIEKFSSGSLVVRLINDMNQVMNMMMILFMQLLRMPIILIGSFVLSIITIPQYWWGSCINVSFNDGVGYIVIQNMNKLLLNSNTTWIKFLLALKKIYRVYVW